MIDRLANLVKLIRIVKERGNWPLIRHSRQQLREFLLCRSGMNRKSIFSAAMDWFYMLKGRDVLVWRLETCGVLYQRGQNEETRQRLNTYL